MGILYARCVRQGLDVLLGFDNGYGYISKLPQIISLWFSLNRLQFNKQLFGVEVYASEEAFRLYQDHKTGLKWRLNESAISLLEHLGTDILKQVTLKKELERLLEKSRTFYCLRSLPHDIIVKIMTENYMTGFENLSIMFSCRAFFYLERS